METEYLKDFLSVVKTMNYSVAADELFSSASSVSRHISALEKSLDVKLFERTTRSLRLTEYGHAFIETAKNIVREENEYSVCVKRLCSTYQKTLRILSIPIIAQYHISDDLLSFINQNADIEVQITETQPANIASVLGSGDFDLALTGSRIEGYAWKEICHSPLVVVVHAEHRMASASRISIDSLKDEPFLLHDKGTRLYDTCINMCRDSGFEPKVIYKSQRPENILRYVSQGMGVALMVKRVVEFYNVPNIRCIDIDPNLDFYVAMIWDSKRPLKTAAKRLMSFLELSGTNKQPDTDCE